MKPLEKFQKTISSVIIPLAEKVLKENKDEFRDVLRAELYGGLKPEIKRKGDKKEIFKSEVFYGYQEIIDSFENLKCIGIYIRRFPYQNTSITKAQHLRYHFENYLHEIYILRERLKKYLKLIQRRYRNDVRNKDIKKIITQKDLKISEVFDPIIKTRGIHVHRHRYNDDDLSRLSLLELLSVGDKSFAPISENAYKEMRKKKVALIQKNNEEIEKFLNFYFDNLYKMLFDDKGGLIYPT